MTIYTPTGMPISFPMDYAFTLLARLYPQYKPYRVLKIAEGMDKAHESVAYLLAFLLFSLHQKPVIIFAVILVLQGFFSWMKTRSKYIDLVVGLGVFFTTFGKLGIISIGLIIFGWHSVGLQGLLAFLCARFFGGVISIIFETQAKKRFQALTGKFDKDLEFNRSFIDAYRFCAQKMGVTLNISVSEQEIKNSDWTKIEIDYYKECPAIFEMRKFS